VTFRTDIMLPWLLLSILYLAAPGSAFWRASSETNAQRLARGLPPLKPTRLFNATRVGPALSRRSAVPVSGILAVYTSPTSTTPVCYIGPGANDDGCVPLNEAVTFTASEGELGSVGSNLVVMAPAQFMGYYLTSHALITDQGASSSYPFTTYSLETLTPTPPNSPPAFSSTADSGQGAYYETAVFFLASDGTVSVVWTNPSGTTDGPSAPLNFYVLGPSPTVPGPIYASYDLSNQYVAALDPVPVIIRLV